MLPKAFTNHAIKPYESKFTVPISRIQITDTPFTVKSLGFNTTFYTWDDTSSAADFSGLTNITERNSGVQSLCGFYSGNGGQPISYRTGEAVAIYYTGWFNTGFHSGATEINFRALGANGGKLTVQVDGSTKMNALTMDQYVEKDSLLVTPANDGWVQINVSYWSAQLEKGFILLWQSDAEPDIWIPVSAGVVNTVPGYETAYELDHVLNSSSLESRNDLKQFSFEIPIIESTSITDDGYYFHRDSKRYIDINDATKYIKKHQLVEAEVGFKKDQHSYYFPEVGSRYYILTADIAAGALMDSDDLIMSQWVKVNPTQSSTAHAFRWRDTDGGARIELGASDTITVYIRDDGANTSSTDITFDYDDGQWHHYALEIRRADNEARFYIDGELNSTIDISSVTGSLTDGSVVGAFYAGSSSSTGFDNGGSMSEMMYFNFGVDGLSDITADSIIKDLYNRPNRVPDEGSSYIQWRLAAVNANTFVNPAADDLTTNDHDFTRSGTVLVNNDDPYLPYGIITSDSNYDDYVKLFIGHVKSFEIVRKADGRDAISVRCESFESLLKEQINLNYPEKFDYWTQGFHGDAENAVRPNSVTFPPTFDAFPIESAVRSLMLRAHIDPTLLYTRRQQLNNAGTIVESGRLFETSNPVLQLERGKDYGNPGIFYTTSKVDNEYRLKSNFGDKIFDYISEITTQYGWEWGSIGFYDGAFFLRTRNNPTDIHVIKKAGDYIGSTIAQDTFTDTNGTAIGSHTMDIGSGWTVDNGSAEIQSNQLDTTAGNVRIVNDVSNANVEVYYEFEMTFTTTTWTAAVMLRRSTATNYIKCSVSRFDDTIKVEEYVAGVGTEIASDTISELSNNTTYALKVTAYGSWIRTELLNSDGDTLYSLDTNSTYNQSSTNHGLELSTDDFVADNFIVKAVTSDPQASYPFFSGPWNAVENDLQAISGTYRDTVTTDAYIEWSNILAERVDIVMGMRSDIGGGTLAYVLSSSGNNTTTFTDIEGQALAVDQVMVVELPTGNIDITLLTNPSGNTWTFRGSTTAPIPAGTRVRSATAKAELVRGSDYATGEVVATAFLPTYMRGGQKDIISRTGVDGVFGDEVDDSPVVVGSLRLFYDGFDPETADNPCQFRIGSGLTRDAHVLRITQLSGTGYTTVNCAIAYDRDAMNPRHNFYTGDAVASGTLVDLSVKDSGEDIRNDVTVVGMKLGTYTPGEAILDVTSNPNNPTNKYVISRAIDTQSIIASGTENFVGRPIQTILIEPGIGSMQRADYWAVNFLNEFRNSEKTGAFQALGHPLLEVGDAILIDDEAKDSIDTANTVWIESISHNWSKGVALTQFSVSSSPPAASYEAKIPVDIDDFGGVVINNITVSSNATDSATPYDPYDSDAVPAEFIEITFDLVFDGWVSIAVYGEDEDTGIVHKIADLLNPTGDENQKGLRWMTAGTGYKVIWDGVDQIGDWNERFLAADNNTSTGANYFASRPTDPNTGAYTGDYSKFYMVFTVKTIDNKTYKINTKEDLSPQVFMYTAPGDVVSPTFSVLGTGDAAFSAGTESTPPTGFLLSDNSNRGAKISFSTDKPAMVYIRLRDHDWHARLPKDFPQDGRFGGGGIQSEQVSNIEFNDDGKYYENTEFINYATTNLFLHPENDLGLFQNDWEINIGERKSAESTGDFFEGHYFYFEAFFTDKSGRTVKETAVAWWNLSGGKQEYLGFGTHYVPDDNATTGDINIGIVWGVAPS